jgi:GNAT superfamily N-acetyltransferase
VRKIVKIVEMTFDNKHLRQEIALLRLEMARLAGGTLRSETSNEQDHDALSRRWVVLDHGIVVAGARLIPEPTSVMMVATNGNLQVQLERIAHMDQLWVHPLWRGQGLGQRLDKIRIAAARATGYNHVVVKGMRGSKRHRALEKLGFVPVDTCPSGQMENLGDQRQPVSFATRTNFMLTLSMRSQLFQRGS